MYGSVTPADVVEALQGSVLRNLHTREKGVRFPGAAAAAAAPGSSGADGDASRAIKVVGEHVVEIEARPGLWCAFTLVLDST